MAGAIRHNLNTAKFMHDYYAGLDIEVARRASPAHSGVMVHIAFDAGLIHLDDVRLMRNTHGPLLERAALES